MVRYKSLSGAVGVHVGKPKSTSRTYHPKILAPGSEPVAEKLTDSMQVLAVGVRQPKTSRVSVRRAHAVLVPGWLVVHNILAKGLAMSCCRKSENGPVQEYPRHRETGIKRSSSRYATFGGEDMRGDKERGVRNKRRG